MFTTPFRTEANKHRNTKQFTKRNNVAKEAVSAAWQTGTRQRSERICNPKDAPRTKPRLCVKTMLAIILGSFDTVSIVVQLCSERMRQFGNGSVVSESPHIRANVTAVQHNG